MKNTPSWKQLENNVIDIASVIYSCSFRPEHISGVDYDAVGRVSDEEWVIIEVTENQTLSKVREDIVKISLARNSKINDGVLVRSFIIMNGAPSNSMVESGRENKVTVCSIEDFISRAFAYRRYKHLRESKSFGSAFDPRSGASDEKSYIPVKYFSNNNESWDIIRISKELSQNRHVVLQGDYGTGKSRCVKELFSVMSRDYFDKLVYPVAIDLRDHWGAATGIEIISGHIQRLGLSASFDSIIRMLNAGKISLLLDGFDEVGSQTFGGSIKKRYQVRRDALSGVRDLISSCKAGVFITGRPNYFESDDELLSALGLSLKGRNVSLLKCSDEFNEDQANEYLSILGLSSKSPRWLPKKPLMFQIISSLERSDAERILESENGEIGFWGQFIDTVCIREAKIHGSIDPDSVRDVLLELARIVRLGKSPLGRITPNDINESFERATGMVPDEAGNLMLSRLCTLGRIEPESPDRQFSDSYIVQLLFADCLVKDIQSQRGELLSEAYIQSLDERGVVFLAQWLQVFSFENDALSLILRSSNSVNSQAISEIASALIIIPGGEISFNGLAVTVAEVAILDTGVRKFKNISFDECLFENVSFMDSKVDVDDGIFIDSSEILNINGLSSLSALPSWISKSCKVVNFETLPNSKRIKDSGLSMSQKLFLSIIQKIFFQRGGGRKENSLYKGGFGVEYDRKMIDKILNILVQRGFVERSKDSSNIIYNPKREFTSRMKSIKDELWLSDDPIWLEVKELSD
ncbi:NACHT domain-containing protein [Oceanobacter mangrovi]|uniref:NACHT domain-containing protein n=1 Tax=Oceanobacter mangrovi TaxID=2862510 RepID=UPI001C8E0700|nr:hypothetical protein [Oceanobacter mangrovi]